MQQEERTVQHEQEEVSLQMDRLWRPVFDKWDCDNDGKIPLDDFKSILKQGNTQMREEMPEEVLNEILDRADWDNDRMISYEEFIRMVQTREQAAKHPRIQRLLKIAALTVVPRCERRTVIRRYNEEYNCMPPPLFLPFATALIIGSFTYYAVELGFRKVPFDSPLIYNPYRRKEAWRYLTYMLIHAGFFHMFFNILVQLTIGIPLELVHKWWRVGIVYMAGVVAGSLAASLSDPKSFLAGASGGVYALLAAHMANVMINLKEMEFGIIRLLGLLSFAALDVGIAVYDRYESENKSKNRTSYAAHIGGALAGLLVGLVVLRNLKVKGWEKILGIVAISVYFFLLVFIVVWNISYTEYFPQQDI